MRWWACASVLVGCAPGGGAVVIGAPDPVEAPALGSDPGEPVAPEAPEAYEMSGFSFVDEHLAGLPMPGARVPLEQDLAFLADQGVTLLVSLTEAPVPADAVAAAGLDLLHLPIPDYHAPTGAQQVAFVREAQARVARGERVAVHCLFGLGRTGTMLATWMVAGGLPADEAIATVRALRPGSIETAEQEAAVARFDRSWP